MKAKAMLKKIGDAIAPVAIVAGIFWLGMVTMCRPNPRGDELKALDKWAESTYKGKAKELVVAVGEVDTVILWNTPYPRVHTDKGKFFSGELTQEFIKAKGQKLTIEVRGKNSRAASFDLHPIVTDVR
jgi:hypothetical protein